MFLEQCELFVVWASVIKHVIMNATDTMCLPHLDRVYAVLIEILQLLCSEGYCYYLDFVSIAYYIPTNRSNVFPPIIKTRIEDFTEEDALVVTGFSISQLKRLLIHFRIPEEFCYRRKYVFTDEESFLHFLVFTRTGDTKLKLSRNYFGGDPRRFTYSVRMMNEHLYDTFYHKISGDSMRMWMPYVTDFRRAIWTKLNEGATVTERDSHDGENNPIRTIVNLSIPFDAFRIFGFLDDTGFRTTATANETRREYGFYDDVQRAFYSHYYSGHGLKVQAVTLPNGLFGSVFVGAWRVSDSGLLNMSGLDTYLSRLLNEFNMKLPAAFNQLPALYGDGIFPQLCSIIARYSMGNENEQRVNRRLASVRQSIEHIFALHTNLFGLFSIPKRFQLLVHGLQCRKMVLNSFFLLNCHVCFNESPNNFNIRPPTIEEYLPLDEVMKPAPIVNDEDLGEVYNYYY